MKFTTVILALFQIEGAAINKSELTENQYHVIKRRIIEISQDHRIYPKPTSKDDSSSVRIRSCSSGLAILEEWPRICDIFAQFFECLLSLF